jgi:ribosomal protein S19
MRVIWKPRTASRLLLNRIHQNDETSDQSTPLRAKRTDFIIEALKDQTFKIHLGNRFEQIGAVHNRIGYRFGNYGLVKKISPIHSGAKLDSKVHKGKHHKGKPSAKRLKKKSYVRINPEVKRKLKFKKLGSFANKFLLKKLFKS